jgi:hypothetical protein
MEPGLYDSAHLFNGVLLFYFRFLELCIYFQTFKSPAVSIFKLVARVRDRIIGTDMVLEFICFVSAFNEEKRLAEH